MKLPSFGSAGSSAKQSLVRFPWVMAASVVAGVLAILLVDTDLDENILLRLFLPAQLGIPLFLAGALWWEEKSPPKSWAPWLGLAGALIGLVLLVVYHRSLPQALNEGTVLRHFQLTLGLHLLVAVLPFQGVTDPLRLWRFNLTLLLRFLNALFFSAVLFAGLSLALLAVEKLLEVGLREEIYPRVWLGTVFVFNTWFFLAGVPLRGDRETQTEVAPKPVEVLGRFLLAPLVTVYLAILMVYLGKVVVTGQWPSGWIGWLVSGVSVAGFLSVLLVFPGWQTAGERWFKIYSRGFFILLLPAVGMLLMAVGQRIAQYGLTEMRYYLGILGIWVGAMALWGLLGRRSWLKAVPATLCLLAFATSCGPWGAFTRSRHSQLRRLDTLLVEHDRLADGIIVKGGQEVGAAAALEIHGCFRYLFQHHGPGTLGNRVGPELGQLLDKTFLPSDFMISGSVPQAVATVLHYLDVELQPASDPSFAVVQFRCFPRRGLVPVHGFTHALKFRHNLKRDHRNWARLGDKEISLRLGGNPEILEVTVGGRPVSFDLADLQERLRRSGEIEVAPDSLLTIMAQADSLRVMLLLDAIRWQEEEDKLDNCMLEGYLLVDYPEEK